MRRTGRRDWEKRGRKGGKWQERARAAKARLGDANGDVGGTVGTDGNSMNTDRQTVRVRREKGMKTQVGAPLDGIGDVDWLFLGLMGPPGLCSCPGGVLLVWKVEEGRHGRHGCGYSLRARAAPVNLNACLPLSLLPRRPHASTVFSPSRLSVSRSIFPTSQAFLARPSCSPVHHVICTHIIRWLQRNAKWDAKHLTPASGYPPPPIIIHIPIYSVPPVAGNQMPRASQSQVSTPEPRPRSLIPHPSFASIPTWTGWSGHMKTQIEQRCLCGLCCEHTHLRSPRVLRLYEIMRARPSSRLTSNFPSLSCTAYYVHSSVH